MSAPCEGCGKSISDSRMVCNSCAADDRSVAARCGFYASNGERCPLRAIAQVKDDGEPTWTRACAEHAAIVEQHIRVRGIGAISMYPRSRP